MYFKNPIHLENMLQYYKNPQGTLIKTQLIKWEKTSLDVLMTFITNNQMNQNDYLKRIAKNCLSLYNQQNNTKLSDDTELLFDVITTHKITSDSFYLEVNFHLPQNGYKEIIYDHQWVLFWIEKVAYKKAKEKSFDEYIKGFEMRYPPDLLIKMKDMWNNYI